MCGDRLKEAGEFMARLSETSPKQMEGFKRMHEALFGEGALDNKTRELVCVALAVKAQCEWCIAFHASQALDHGATREEILEAGWMAVLMGGGPSLMYLGVLERELEKLEKKTSGEG